MKNLLATSLVVATLSIAAVSGAPGARAGCATIPGDVSPGLIDDSSRPPTVWAEGDERIDVGDALLVLRASLGLESLRRAPSRGECDAAPGDVAPATLDASTAPPTFVPMPDGELDVGDVVLLLRVAVGLEQLAGSGREIRLGRDDHRAWVGVRYLNDASLSLPFRQPATWSLAGPSGASIDALTGDLSFVPSGAGNVVLRISVTDGRSIVSHDLMVEVEEPSIEARGMVGPAGGRVEVTNAASPLVGAWIDIPAGALEALTDVRLALVSDPPAWGTGTPLSPSILLLPDDTPLLLPATLHVPYDEAALPPGLGADDVFVGAFDYVAESARGTTTRPLTGAWALLGRPVSSVAGEAVAQIESELREIVRVFGLPDPGCSAAPPSWLWMRTLDCPFEYTSQEAIDWLSEARAGFVALGWPNPGDIRLVIMDIDAPEDGDKAGFVTTGAPTTVHLNAGLDRPSARTTLAHELFHVFQYAMLGPSNRMRLHARNAWLHESTAAWSEEWIFDDDDCYRNCTTNRIAADAFRVALDDPDHRYTRFAFFDYLSTTGRSLQPLFRSDAAAGVFYAAPGGAAKIVEDALGGPLADELLAFLHHHDFTRDEGKIEEIQSWGFRRLSFATVNSEGREARPPQLVTRGVFDSLAGRTIGFRTDSSSPPTPGAHLFVRLDGDAAVAGAIREADCDVATAGAVLAPISKNDAVLDLGEFRGCAILTIVNPEHAPSRRGLGIEAYFGEPLEVTIAEPADGSIARASTVTVRGAVVQPADPAQQVTKASVRFGRSLVSVNVDAAGAFSVVVPLLPGSNGILVSASSPDGRRAGSARVEVWRSRAGSPVACGNAHSLSCTSVGTPWSWGQNNRGQLGDGSTATQLLPVPVVDGTGSLGGIASVGARAKSSAAIGVDGRAWTWGDNSTGQLGDGTTRARTVAAPVLDSSGLTALGGIACIAMGQEHALAVAADGTAWAWGANMVGQLGDGWDGCACYAPQDHFLPVRVVGPGNAGVLSDLLEVAAGGSHSLALSTGGTVWAWGGNVVGQLGNGFDASAGVRSEHYWPHAVLGPGGAGMLSDAEAIAAGHVYSLALRRDGTVWAWGNNDQGQLGNGTTAGSLVPTQVMGPNGVGALTGIRAIAAWVAPLALAHDGTVWEWGGVVLHPRRVPGENGSRTLSNIVAIATSESHRLALAADGTLWAWGINSYGELGDGTLTSSTTPVRVNGLP